MTLPFKLPVHCDDVVHLYAADDELIAKLDVATPAEVDAIVERINAPRHIYIVTEALPELIADQCEDNNVNDILWTGHPYLTLEEAERSVVGDVAFHAAKAGEKSPLVTWRWSKPKNGPTGVWKATAFNVKYMIREYKL